MSTLAPAGAATLLRQRSLIFFLLSRSLSRFSSQIGAVAIGWQVYDMTGRAFDLGMVGLVQFLSTALLIFVVAKRPIVSSASGWCRSASSRKR
jgi:NADH:ubiquinone oxidoreductase subunit K